MNIVLIAEQTLMRDLEQVIPCQVTLPGTNRRDYFPSISKRAERLILWIKLGSLGIERIVPLIIIVTKCVKPFLTINLKLLML